MKDKQHEEWIEEKARELRQRCTCLDNAKHETRGRHTMTPNGCREFIYYLMNEAPKPKVSRELIKKYADRLNITKMMGFSQETMVSEIIDMFKEAGVEVE